MSQADRWAAFNKAERDYLKRVLRMQGLLLDEAKANEMVTEITAFETELPAVFREDDEDSKNSR